MSELYEDLLKDVSESFEDGNYFLITITELELATTYPLEFRWKYKDGTAGKNWSAVYNINTQGSTVPNEPDLDSGDVVGGAGFISVTWNGNDASNNPIQNIDRVDIHIAGTSFGDGTKPAGSFKTAGTQTFTAEPGIYIVQLKAIRVDGATSFFSSGRTVTVTEAGEPIENPIAPTGFTARAILGGIELTWTGGYSGGATWSGFEAINVYAGTSSSATVGTYVKAGQMTANKTTNKIVIPIDGTYVRYGFPTYIHVSSINKATPPVESSIVANVANATPSQVVNTDLIDEAVTATKLALNSVTETKIANDAITTPKILAGAITSGKIDALAITSDKIAANAIIAGKIDTNAITADLINAGTLKATTYIRVGTAGGARIDIAAVSSGITSGLNIYNSGGQPIFEAPLGGGVTVTGHLKATQISTTSGDFTVSTSGILTARSANIDGTIKATAGYIGGTTSGIYIASGAIQNDSSGSQFKLDNTGKARFGSLSGNAIIIDPTAGNGGYYIYHTSGGQSGSASGIFSVSTSGNLTSTSGTIGGWTIGSTTLSGGSTTLNSNGTISGATVSGGLIRTGSTGARIEVSGSDQGTNPNSIVFYNPGGSAVSHIVPMNIGGSQFGLLMHYGGTADQSGGSYPQIFIGSINASMSSRQFSGGPQATVSVDYQLGVTLQTTSADININGPAKFSSTMFAPNLSTTTSAANLRVATGTIGEISEVTASSIRFKENVVPIDSIIEISPNKLLDIPVRSFKYKDSYLSESDERFSSNLPGFIAEEVAEVYPIAVDYADGQPYSWNERFMIPGMLALIQNLNQELISIKSRLDALEG